MTLRSGVCVANYNDWRLCSCAKRCATHSFWQRKLVSALLVSILVIIISSDLCTLPHYLLSSPSAARCSELPFPFTVADNGIATRRASHFLPHVLSAAAAREEFDVEDDADEDFYDDGVEDEEESEEEAAATEGNKRVTFDKDLRPTLMPWPTVRAALRDASCFTTRALPRITAAAITSNDSPETDVDSNDTPRRAGQGSEEGDRAFVNRTDPAASPLALPPLCRKPIVLISGRSRDCASCTLFAEAVLGPYAAEWAFIRSHVTLVDAGDPMSEQLVRYPYPLWYDKAAVDRLLTLTPRFDSFTSPAVTPSQVSMAASDVAAEKSLRDTIVQQLRSDGEADYGLFSAGLRQKAALLVKAPAAQAGHRWARMVRRTFAYPNEYVLRIVFVYPHNGSVMRDIVDEGIFEGSSIEYPHFFTNAKHFFLAVKKAVRVMEWLERYGDY